MNLLLLTLMYPSDLLAEATASSKDGLQMQINAFQCALLEGLQAGLSEGEAMAQVNALPVGVFPTKYKKLLLKSFMHNGIRELGCLNLPYVKQRQRERGAYRAIVEWAKQSPQNRTVLVYTLYLPYMRAVERAKRAFPDLKAAVIVTDLPNELGISSGRRGLMRKAEYRMGDERIRLCEAFDGFVPLTKHMAEALSMQGKPQVVVEGLVSTDGATLPRTVPERFTVLYTGTLNKELGVDALMEAFVKMPEFDLWLCGRGDLSSKAESMAQAYPNIHSYGFVPRQRALELQAQVSALVNPRMPAGAYTRYSFPSKTLEYLRAGKPVLCYKLDGIPDDYDPYLSYIQKESADGICEDVRALATRSREELKAMGDRGRDFALSCKNATAQAARILAMLRSL